MIKHLDHVDVVIVGLGAGGGPAAKVLAEAGYSVVGFDKGPWLRNKEHYSGDELKFQNRSYLWPDVDLMPRTVRSDENSESRIFNFSPVPSAVGGGTTHMAGWTPRPRPSDFIMRTLHGDLEGASLADWPYRYEHLEPYLTKVEWSYGISGLDGAEPGAGFRSRPYPSGPLGPTKFGEKFYEGCRKLGINAMPLPMSHLTERNELGRKAVNRTSFWNQYGDPTETRSTVATTYIPEALATGNFEVRADSFVREVTVGRDGKATGVIYIDEQGVEHEQRARVVILALGAIESARLMLMSKSSLFPDGIANDVGSRRQERHLPRVPVRGRTVRQGADAGAQRLHRQLPERRLDALLRDRRDRAGTSAAASSPPRRSGSRSTRSCPASRSGVPLPRMPTGTTSCIR